jgi:hypothetical protein
VHAAKRVTARMNPDFEGNIQSFFKKLWGTARSTSVETISSMTNVVARLYMDERVCFIHANGLLNSGTLDK